MPVKDYPWNLDVFDSHRFWGYSHRPPPYPCEVRAKDDVSIFDGGFSDITTCNHVRTYHSQEFTNGGMSQHALCFARSLCLFHFLLGEAFHLAVYSLDCVLNKAQCHFGLDFLQVQVRHTLLVVPYDNVSCISMDHKLARVRSLRGMIGHRPDLLQDLQRDYACHSALVEPHFLDGTEGARFVHR